MNKELTPLKVLENIKQLFVGSSIDLTKQFNIIETALKDYEELKKLKLLPYPKVNDEEYRRNVIKRLQAFEMIKEKFVIPAYIMNTENVGEYNKWLRKITFRKDYQKRALTQEEYDLLKEVLK